MSQTCIQSHYHSTAAESVACRRSYEAAQAERRQAVAAASRVVAQLERAQFATRDPVSRRCIDEERKDLMARCQNCDRSAAEIRDRTAEALRFIREWGI